MTLRRLVVAALLVAGLAFVAIGSAVGKPSLTIDPDPVARGESFTLQGCGYPEASSISFEVSGPRKSGIHYFTAGSPVPAGGCYEDDWLAWWAVAGDYQITSWYRDARGATHKASVVKFSVT
jgi:hypothetical protein